MLLMSVLAHNLLGLGLLIESRKNYEPTELGVIWGRNLSRTFMLILRAEV